MRYTILQSDYILSPLGHGTAASWKAIQSGRSALRHYEGLWGMPFDAQVAIISDIQLAQWTHHARSRYENLCIEAALGCLRQCSIDITSNRVGIILSTTKADIAQLTHGRVILPSDTAERIASELGNPNTPIVLSNACISGGQAQLAAMRLLEMGEYDHMLVIGADELSPFVVSGFQSLKSLSAMPCRPFDIDRMGLNLGEGAAAMLLSAVDELPSGCWELVAGSIRNDAIHISNPSKTAEGAWRAITECISQADRCKQCNMKEQICCISAHGTATLYNDEMESVAIQRAGLQHVPTIGLKGYLGHTMGAAGVIETLIMQQMLESGRLIPTLGYQEAGTSRLLNVSTESSAITGNVFLKMLSGFGGGNVALLWQRH